MVTALSPVEYLALVTLGPLVFGALIVILGVTQRLTRKLALGLSVVGGLVPVLGLPFLAPEVALGDPLAVRPFGLGAGFAQWITPTYRIDAFALATALAVAYLVTPLIVWMAFIEGPSPSRAADPQADGPATDPDAVENGATHDVAFPDTPELTDEPASSHLAARSLFITLGLALALEFALLTLLFADNLVLLGVAWLLVAALAWALGEAASDGETVDRLGLLAMLPGPVLWLMITLVAAVGAHAPRLIDLTGRTAFNWFECVWLAVALALAGGAYPAITWVRRRAALATPAGIAAIVLAMLPSAVYIAGRTYAAAADGTNHWPLFGSPPQVATTPPPITAGVAFVVLGTLTVAVSALVALGRRDGRSLVALLATAQVGWALVGIGAGRPVSILGVILLLPAATLGLGAMLAALVAGGTLTSDVEPDADGPRPVGAPARPLGLAAWSIGAAGLIGAPFLAGFAPRHLIGAGALEVGTLTIPLMGLCWAGDVLLGLTVLRATAPALGNWVSAPVSARAGHATSADLLRDAPAALCAGLALVAGISPALVIAWFGRTATLTLILPGSLPQQLTLGLAGYTIGPAQWFGTLAWLVAVIVAVATLVAVRPGAARSDVPVFRGGLVAEDAAATVTPGPQTAAEAPALAQEAGWSAGLSEPQVAWSELQPAFESVWVLPAGEWLLAGIDDEEDDESATPEAEKDESLVVSVTHEEVPHGDD
jgi:hypothetical protein